MPPVVVVATVGGVSSNSYLTLADAETYFASRLYTDTWDEASDDRKNRALIMATRLMDTWFDWSGEVASINQALLWPRMGVIRPNRTLFVGSSVWPWANLTTGLQEPSNAIPTRIAEATAVWAQELLASDRTADSTTESEGLKRLKAGPIELEFNSGGSVAAKPVPDAVLAAVSAYGTLRTRSGSGTVTLLRA